MVTETMRGTCGLELMCSELYYNGVLQPGAGPAIDSPARKTSAVLKTFFNSRYSALEREPDNCIYPVHLNVHADCDKEVNGRSYQNKGNVAVTMELILDVISKGIVSPEHIGIVTPYNAQVDLYTKLKQRDVFSHLIEVGTVEYFQGRERMLMICDLVRSHSDKEVVGFLADKGRLNVMLSRQLMGLVIVGDSWCIRSTEEEQEDDDIFKAALAKAANTGWDYPTADVAQRRREHLAETNEYLESLFKLLAGHKRVVEVAKAEIPGDKYFGKGWDTIQESANFVEAPAGADVVPQGEWAAETLQGAW